MTAYTNGDPATPNAWIAERYLYDASGYRLVRFPEAGDGRPVVAIRDSAGQLLAEFRPEPLASPQPALHKDYLYGVGQLLVERRRGDTFSPLIAAHTTLELNGSYGIKAMALDEGRTYKKAFRFMGPKTREALQLILDGRGIRC